ncbi:GFA family protein [Solimonas sp. K1W22B-7]|uniref:GFA family protein n=1 Tax=Solimonas sp. K1W22B-7 TaxID=2303331 RepID=UPI000E32D453|nr:GFA family protein [Solimonas sp. K1W22B-7]AXQ27331.1 GFA family protein [Solimonas sp. K1W22B-7]
MSESRLEGGCQCGDIRYAVSGAPVMAAICHCSMCRRANAAPVVAWAMYAQDQVAFSRAQPQAYASSPEAQRGFCPRCGTQISFTASFLPGLIDITIGSLDQPEAMQPTLHYWHSRHLGWAEFADSLPRFPELPPFE